MIVKQKTVIFLLAVMFLFSCETSKESATKTTEPCVPNTNENCVCLTNYDPVCGCDNKTYPNECHAKCSNVTYVKGACKNKK